MKKHISRVGMLVLTGLLALSTTHSVKANLITNGGFETGNFTGWTQSGNIAFTGVSGSFMGTPPHSGNFQAFFGPVDSHGFITQDVPTTPGRSYVLTFWLANLGDPANFFAIHWGDSTIFSSTDSPPFSYTEFTFNLTSSTDFTSLQFEFMHNPSFFLVDEVRLSVPDSGSTFSLLSLASLGIVGLRRKLSC